MSKTTNKFAPEVSQITFASLPYLFGKPEIRSTCQTQRKRCVALVSLLIKECGTRLIGQVVSVWDAAGRTLKVCF